MKRFYIILILLLSIHFWRWVYLPQSFHTLTDMLTFVIFGISLVNSWQDNVMRFKGAIVVMMIGIALNILSAFINNGQSPKDSFIVFWPYYFILLYFFLHENKVDREDLEWIIIAFAVLYGLFYLMQVSAFPRRIFAGNMFADRGTIRIRIEGSGFLMLAYFLLLNKYLLERKVWTVLVALFLFVILLKGGFRTLTAGAVLLSGITFLKLVKYSVTNYLLIVVAVVMFLAMLQFEGTATIINSMVQASEEQQEMGERYIRVMQFDYFTEEYPENFSYYIFGGGIPGGYGDYSAQMNFIAREYGFYWVDLGLIGFYFVIGGVTLLGLLMYTLRGIFIKLPPEFFYIKMYFAYLFLVSFTTMEIYRPGMFVTEAIGLYLIDVALNGKNKILSSA